MSANVVARQGSTRFVTMALPVDGIPRLLVPAEKNRQRRMVVRVAGLVFLSASPSAISNLGDVSSDTFAAATRDVFIIAPNQAVYALAAPPGAPGLISAAISDMLE